MPDTTLFLSNTTQAVRLPRDVAFPEGVTRVSIIRQGNRRIITPAGTLWDEFFDAPGVDFAPRDQPSPQRREAF